MLRSWHPDVRMVFSTFTLDDEMGTLAAVKASKTGSPREPLPGHCVCKSA